MPRRRKKSVYIQPPHEVNSKRQHVRRATPARQAAKRTPAELPEPTLRRTARMLPIYFVVMFGLQYLLTGGQGLSGEQRLANALLIATMVSVIFFPVLHMLEKSRYKRMTKLREGSARPAKGKRPAKG